jgi:transposase
LERIRWQAVALHRGGVSTAEIAGRLGRSRRWLQLTLRTFRLRGKAALGRKPHPGRKPKLPARYRPHLLKRLLRGAVSNGFATELWTCPRVRELIRRVYGVEYHVDHLPRLLQQLGLSCQKPQRRARQRDEAAIARWTSVAWERIKKTHDAGRPRWFFSMNPGCC